MSQTEIMVGWAAAGDTNLDGLVDALDIGNLVGGGLFNATRVATWDTGDFNYDGIFDMLDVADMIAASLYDQGSYRSTTPSSEPPSVPVVSPHAVAFSVTNSWTGNIAATVTIRNQGTTPINGWTLEFDLDATLTSANLWGAEIVSVSGTRYRLKSASYTATIPAAGTISFSFNAGGLPTVQMSNKVFNGLPVA
jgi:hypothetical protein